MARVTVEDCLDFVDNRFELVLLASKRARQISQGKDAMVPLENDKPTVVALREIAEGKINQAVIDAVNTEEEQQENADMAEEPAPPSVPAASPSSTLPPSPREPG